MFNSKPTTHLLRLCIGVFKRCCFLTQGKTSEALTKLMSLQATEACIIEMNKEGMIVKSEDIPVELVQRGGLLKVYS